jgi:hypothetical protein
MRNTIFAIAITLAGCGGIGTGGKYSCIFDNGRQCDSVLGCPDDRGCNWCSCGDGAPSCTQVYCTQPATSCRSDGDCAGGSHCAYDPGCTTTSGRCVAAASCDGRSADAFCDCNGHTVAQHVSCGVGQPYQHAGPCG